MEECDSKLYECLLCFYQLSLSVRLLLGFIKCNRVLLQFDVSYDGLVNLIFRLEYLCFRLA